MVGVSTTILLLSIFNCRTSIVMGMPFCHQFMDPQCLVLFTFLTGEPTHSASKERMGARVNVFMRTHAPGINY